MSLIKVGHPITDIRGPVKGVYFTRDKSGLHCTPKPRRVKSFSAKQTKQKAAFIKARSYSHKNRIVSYNIFRALNALAPKDPPTDYKPDMK